MKEISAQFSKKLIAWYEINKRDLPWRADPTPYHVWLSEIMLQQTRVEAVKAYYARFLKEIPDIETLAQTDEERLLKLWEGLGYYARARNLQKAARMVVEAYDGAMPDTVDELLRLPGIGAYTAGAIASIAFHKRAALVDGNVLRVMARLRLDDRDTAKEETKKAVYRELTARYLPKEDALCGVFNQALMELGAVVCVPNGAPKCATCPVRSLCLAYRENAQTDYPKKSAKKPRRIENRTVFLICDRERVAVRKRPAKGLLAGLYEFPSTEGHLRMADVRRYCKREGLPALRIKALPDAVHIFTHVEWHMKGYLIYVETTGRSDMIDRKQIDEQYAIPSAFKTYTAIAKSALPLDKETD